MPQPWIKMRKNLPTDPRVVRISSALRADRLRTVGALHSAWCLLDEHTEEGVLRGYDFAAFDDIVGVPGLAQAMQAVGWLEATTEGLVAPRFTEHNGQSARRRAVEAERKASARGADRRPHAVRTDCAIEKEKEREDKSPLSPPTGGRRRQRASGEGSELLAHAADIGGAAQRFVELFPAISVKAGWSPANLDQLNREIDKRGWTSTKFDAVMQTLLTDGGKFATPTPREVFTKIKTKASSDYAAGGAA